MGVGKHLIWKYFSISAQENAQYLSTQRGCELQGIWFENGKKYLK
jgi:hypothetical protein